jgi:hypothetical protein
MTKATKTFLVLSLAGFAAGVWIDSSGQPVDPKWTAVLPMGAVFFGLFLIFLMLQKEMAAFDREKAAKFELLRQERPSRVPEPARSDQRGIAQLKKSRL